MEFVQCWLYTQKGNDVNSLLVKSKADYDLLIEQGYKESPKELKEKPIEKVIEKAKEDISEVKENVSVTELNKLDDSDDEELDLMTKEQLVDFAQEKFNKELKVRDTKVSLINTIKALKED